MGKGLLTIGYEGGTLADFLETLRRAKVETVIDIRDVPISRKTGFSKVALARALEAQGIAYLHLKALGDPKDGRDAARSGDFELFKQIYHAHLAKSEAKLELTEAVGVAKKNRACLLCYERDPKMCHRSMVAKAMTTLAEFDIIHLGVREGSAKQLHVAAKHDGRKLVRKVG